MPLSDIANVSVTTQNPGVTRAGFGVLLILATSPAWVERTRTYSSIAGVGADFSVADPAYMAANAYFSQEPAPTRVVIGRAANKPTQRFAIGVQSGAAVVGATYSLRVATEDSGPAWTSQDVSYTAAAAVAWVASNTYALGDVVNNDSNKIYVCITAGAAAGSGGPTGTSADITDNVAHWRYVGTGAGGTGPGAILQNLKVLIDALAAPDIPAVCSLQGTAGTSDSLRILLNTAGDFLGVEVADMQKLSIAQDHADPGVAADLSAIRLENKTWYGLVTLHNSKAVIEAAAGWAESHEILYVPDSQDSEIATVALGSASDVFKALKDSSFARSAPIFHPANDEFIAAAEVGRFFPIDPGGETWRLKSLAGPKIKTYTETHETNIKARYANYYADLAGANVVQGQAKVSANEYIDVIRFRDWFKARLQERLVNLLIQNNKISFDDDGIAAIEAEVRAQIAEGIAKKGIAKTPKPTVTVPAAIDVDPELRAERELPDVNAKWRLAGAIHKIDVNVAVSV